MGKPNGWRSPLFWKCHMNFGMVVFVKDTDETVMLKSPNFSASFVLHLSESAPGHAGADEGHGSNEEAGLLTFDQFLQNSQFVKLDELPLCCALSNQPNWNAFPTFFHREVKYGIAIGSNGHFDPLCRPQLLGNSAPRICWTFGTGNYAKRIAAVYFHKDHDFNAKMPYSQWWDERAVKFITKASLLGGVGFALAMNWGQTGYSFHDGSCRPVLVTPHVGHD